MKEKDNETKDADNAARPDQAGFITKASAQYCNVFPLRAAIQGIPGLGSSLDTMLAGLGAKWKYDRLEDFIAKLSERLTRLEHTGHLGSLELDEALFDFMVQVFDQVIRARSGEKRKRFANLVAKQVVNKSEWHEAEAACRLIGDLSELDIEVLTIAVDLAQSKPNFYLSFSDKWAYRSDQNVIDLRSSFRSVSNLALRMVCSDLVAKGLLHDAGVGHLNAKAMEDFTATDLGKWLMDWISDPG